ncbi:MAG: hypothetical protein HYX94_06915 [Chloroflexi bacterium]|nr:hypothetical protein [Chloroflexota bacterium]
MLTSELVAVSQSVHSMYEDLYERGWTDGLPIIPPTDDLVRACIDYVGRDAGEVVGEIPPACGVATVEKVAINAVMAGCRPEYMPVLLAAIEALLDPDYVLRAVQVTTNPTTPFLIVNGPIRQQIGLNCGASALGPGFRANATIGRAIRLILLNVGGGTPVTVDKATLGWPGKFTMCLGENEEASPWEPLHVERGFSPEESTVTVVSASGTLNLYAGTRGEFGGADSALTILAHSMTAMGTNEIITAFHNHPVLILSQIHAGIFANVGLSKQQVKQILWERARLPMGLLPPWLAEQKRACNLVVDGMMLLTDKPERFTIIVAGGPSGLHSTYVPVRGSGVPTITRPIKLPGR